MRIHDILELDTSASHSAIDEAYRARLSELSGNQFAPGSEGFEIAKKMDDLKSAYTDYVDSMVTSSEKVNEPTLDKVDELTKAGRIDEAQQMLDKIGLRNGQWHYYQALVFYKKEWLTECRKHLVTAVSMEPNNQKYKDTLQKLDMVIGNNSYDPNNLGGINGQNTANSYSSRNQMVDCCCMYCLMEACCASCRGCH